MHTLLAILLTAAVVQLLNLLLFTLLQRTTLLHLLSLRQQLAILQRSVKRPQLKNRDRLFWALLSRLWRGWASALVIVKPQTVLRWQRRRLRDFWRRRSGGRPGRPRILRAHISFIRRISSDHPEYGEDRIALELEIKFGIHHAPSTVARYMVKPRGGPRNDQRWRTFLKNQAQSIWVCDFFVQHTLTFRAFYVFVIMHLESRKIVQFAVTEHPTLDWIKQQVRNAAFDQDLPKFLIHDNDGKFGQLGRPLKIERSGKTISCRSSFAAWLWEVIGIRGIPIPYGAPNAAAHIERLIGTLRREGLDRLLIGNARQLRVILEKLIIWYNEVRVHQGIQGIPDPDPDPALAGPLPPPDEGRLVAIPILGGLHHDYRLVA